MPINTSGNGSKIYLAASKTFPIGFQLSEFATDVDPYDSPATQRGDSKMSVNGTLEFYQTAAPIDYSISLIDGSDDDINLQALFEANRIGGKKVSAKDVITMTVTYPDGSFDIYSGGIMTQGPTGKSLATEGKYKSKTYSFQFEDRQSS